MSNESSQTQQLAEYIKKNISKGYTADALKYSLMNQGYGRTSVERALEVANKQLADEAPKMKERPQIRYENLSDLNVVPEKGPNIFVRLWRKIFG